MKTREYELIDLKLRLLNEETKDQQLKVLWNWIHIKKINFKQFSELVKYIK
jgi:hypothetical protein